MKIGIRKEDKNIWERRAPLTPQHVAELQTRGLEVVIEPSAQRAFADQAYREAGATLQADLSDCPVVLAVKEIPTAVLRQNRTYVYFAHVTKGQPHNMGMLKRLLELGCTLIDYEKVVDDQGTRLIFFGRHAGLAGMLDSLWALGQRLSLEGWSTPLAELRCAHTYPDLEAAKAELRQVARRIAADGLPPGLHPLVVGFAGYGNVSRGAQEIFDLLPFRQIEAEQLSSVLDTARTNELIKVVFREEHMVVPRQADQVFDLQTYYLHPERFRGVFARYVPYLTALINCIYWTPDCPRLISRDLLRGLFGAGHTPRLRVIGDISCDIEGAVECTLRCTDPGDPVYVYLPEQDRIVSGLAGHGPVVLAVDNLPCELPAEASQSFGDALLSFVPAVATADYSRPFEQLDLPAAIKRAVVVHRGQLTPDYAHLRDHLDKVEGGGR